MKSLARLMCMTYFCHVQSRTVITVIQFWGIFIALLNRTPQRYPEPISTYSLFPCWLQDTNNFIFCMCMVSCLLGEYRSGAWTNSSGKVLAWHLGAPGFDLQHPSKRARQLIICD